MMPQRDLRYWCWWMSRYVWYSGWMYRGDYVFEDVTGAQVCVSPEMFAEMEVR